MRTAAVVLLLFVTKLMLAQQNIVATDHFAIIGKVKKELLVTLTDLRSYRQTELKNVNTSCSPKKEEKTELAKGVLIKDILDSVAFAYNSPKELNEFYFVFVASDGYRLVYSFNEIYNTETGKNLFIAVSMDGKDISEMGNRILVLTLSDIKSGKRNMKGLKEIIVCKAE